MEVDTGQVLVMEPSGGKLLFTLADVCDYYEQFRPAQMENFARFVISKGYGATTPQGTRNDRGQKIPETWQSCGRRLFGERFIPVMERVLVEHRAALAAKSTAVQPIADPEF
jgi:hypothetical protein